VDQTGDNNGVIWVRTHSVTVSFFTFFTALTPKGMYVPNQRLLRSIISDLPED